MPCRRAVPDAPISRSDLDHRADAPDFGKASPWKARLSLVTHSGEALVVKDVRPMPWWTRRFGRALLWREIMVYQRLSGLDGMPRFRGVVDRDAFCMSFVDGVPLSDVPAGTLPLTFFSKLCAIVESLHERGVLHLDLHQRRNILATRVGEPAIVDFGAAIALGSSRFARRRLLPWLARLDHTGWLKFKQRHQPEALSKDERELLRWRSRWRTLWRFNLNARRFRARNRAP